MLVASGLSKHYGGVAALKDASLAVERGEVHAIVGENGAGKSTLVKIISGAVRPDAGRIELDGREVRFHSTRQAAEHGIAIVSQELMTFGDLTVLENLFPMGGPGRLGWASRRRMRRHAAPLLEELGLDVPPDARVGTLALADRQLLEICRALLQEPRVLILDEPTSALPRAAADRLAATIDRLVGRGLAILYISHFLEEVMRVARRVTVLRDGDTVLAGAETSAVGLAALVTAMLGDAGPAPPARPAPAGTPASPGDPDAARNVEERDAARAVDGRDAAWASEGRGGARASGGRGVARASEEPGAAGASGTAGESRAAPAAGAVGTPRDPLPEAPPAPADRNRPDPHEVPLALDAVEVPGRLRDVSMTVAPGEIVGLAGLQGAGHLAVLDVVCGRLRPAAGTVRLPGGAAPRSPRHAVAAGVAYVSGDRKGRGLMLDRPLWENITAVRHLGLGRAGVLPSKRRLVARAERLIADLRIKGGPYDLAGRLSGGNQQKVVLAKWLDAEPDVLVLDDPTRGVDVGARAELHRIIRDLAGAGRTILITSTDLTELVDLCHRAVVFQHGRIAAEIGAEALSEQALSVAMNAGFVAVPGAGGRPAS